MNQESRKQSGQVLLLLPEIPAFLISIRWIRKIRGSFLIGESVTGARWRKAAGFF